MTERMEGERPDVGVVCLGERGAWTWLLVLGLVGEGR